MHDAYRVIESGMGHDCTMSSYVAAHASHVC